jgi:DNA-binding response OmpR family regulator
MGTILLADHNTGLRRLVHATLEAEGHALLETADGDEAWALLQAHRPELAILALDVPGRSGLWLARAIRLEPQLDQTRIILLSAWDSLADERVGLSAAADRYLTRPFSPENLVAAVREVLNHGGAARSPA